VGIVQSSGVAGWFEACALLTPAVKKVCKRRRSRPGWSCASWNRYRSPCLERNEM
jgi:hypothetical protein